MSSVVIARLGRLSVVGVAALAWVGLAYFFSQRAESLGGHLTLFLIPIALLLAVRAAPWHRPALVVVVAALGALLSGALAILSHGNPFAALAIPALCIVLRWSMRVPLWANVLGVITLLLVFNNPSENPGMGRFKTILDGPGSFFYLALEKSVPVEGLKAFGLEWMFGTLVVFVVVRGGLKRINSGTLIGSLCAFSGIAYMGVFGLGTGGNVRMAMLQVRPMVTGLVLLPVLVGLTFSGRQPVRWLFRLLVSIAFVRASVGIFYWWTIVRTGVYGASGAGSGTYVLTHSDSVLMAGAVLWVLLKFYDRPSLRSALTWLPYLAVIGLFIIINNRRLAIVEIVMAAGFIYIVGDRTLRRKAHITILAMIPAFVLYVAAAWNSTAGWASPVQTLKSVSTSEDTSSQTRDIENYNLIVTLRAKKVTGWGLGHEYLENVVAYDISKHFSAYRYVPHNSMLWLWTAGSVMGFSLIWAALLAGVYVSIRLYRNARVQEDRLLALTTIGLVITYGVQAYGDMGLQSWMGGMLLGTFIGASGTMAQHVGGWPRMGEVVERVDVDVSETSS